MIEFKKNLKTCSWISPYIFVASICMASMWIFEQASLMAIGDSSCAFEPLGLYMVRFDAFHPPKCDQSVALVWIAILMLCLEKSFSCIYGIVGLPEMYNVTLLYRFSIYFPKKQWPEYAGMQCVFLFEVVSLPKAFTTTK